MLLLFLFIIPLIGLILILILNNSSEPTAYVYSTKTIQADANINPYHLTYKTKEYTDRGGFFSKPIVRLTTLIASVINVTLSLILFILYNSTSKHFQFLLSEKSIDYYDLHIGLDGLSVYFLLLTTIITPIAIISNWKSIQEKVIYFLSIMLLLEIFLLLIFGVLNFLMFYVFFESILGPLFVLIGIHGSKDKQRASFYFFLYTFLGSLFMLLSILTVSYLSGCEDIDLISTYEFIYITQLSIFVGIFIAFSVKTPVIYLNGWLLKAHVESPLSGSIVLAAIVLKLSLYGIFRLILILSPKTYIAYIFAIFAIGVMTIFYASLSTLRTIDIKELIAYSSVSHAAVYFVGVFSNVIQGIIGSICLGLAHGFVSSGLFIVAGGVLYDRSGTRLISSYKGLVQAMPLLSILFFILCLGNCGAPLTINFVGEFMSLYGVFERLPLAGALASSSIVFSAAFTIYMFNRIIFGGSLFYKNWEFNYPADLDRREYSILLILVIFTVFLGIYPSIIIDGLNYVAEGLLYSFNGDITHNVPHRSNIMRLLNSPSPEPQPHRSNIMGLLNTLTPSPEPPVVPRNTPATDIPNPVRINPSFNYVDFMLDHNTGRAHYIISKNCVPDESYHMETTVNAGGFSQARFRFVEYKPEVC